MSAAIASSKSASRPAQTFFGLVVSAKLMQKTIKVRVARTKMHPTVLKPITTHKNFLVHDAKESCVVGDWVRIDACRKQSKNKNFKLGEIVHPAVRVVEPDTGVVHSQASKYPNLAVGAGAPVRRITADLMDASGPHNSDPQRLYSKTNPSPTHRRQQRCDADNEAGLTNIDETRLAFCKSANLAAMPRGAPCTVFDDDERVIVTHLVGSTRRHRSKNEKSDERNPKNVENTSMQRTRLKAMIKLINVAIYNLKKDKQSGGGDSGKNSSGCDSDGGYDAKKKGTTPIKKGSGEYDSYEYVKSSKKSVAGGDD
ncbi:37S ribosomal protein S17 mitochondrial [Physocladia obscura]|uniref:37S ribosomal protein S17 mitochondrial n=1 Tax=Physocladia obscura TaxID=109957 RepID=A0AAD5SWJ0_9FUNG|nr:37S ribosomal protein S17 mitochondrial [Physocladia obscura]